MGRTARFHREDIVGAALRLVAEGGPRAATISAVANEVGAPVGSIYHRYASREHLLAELWMETVEGFQSGFVAALSAAHDVEGAVRAARFLNGWTREHPLEARLLLLHHRRDFVPGDWPEGLVRRAAALEPQLGAALKSFAKRAFGDAGREQMARLRFALLDAPFGGIKPYVQSGKPIPPILDEIIADTVRGVLSP